MAKTTIDKQLEATDEIRALIRRFEANGDYNIVYGGIPSHVRPANLTGMTIAEVQRFQRSLRGISPSTAVGAYQTIRATLSGAHRGAGIPDSAMFDERTQDLIALHLLKGRGLDDYLAGEMDAHDFANAIAMEWASLPVVIDGIIGGQGNPLKAGQSYYAGDGLNKAHCPVDDVLKAVQAIKKAPASARPRARPVESKTLQKAVAAVTVGAGGVAVNGAETAGIPDLDIHAIARDLEAAVGTLDRLQSQNHMLLAVIAGMALLNIWLMRDRLRDWWEGRR